MFLVAYTDCRSWVMERGRAFNLKNLDQPNEKIEPILQRAYNTAENQV